MSWGGHRGYISVAVSCLLPDQGGEHVLSRDAEALRVGGADLEHAASP
jgi:hypothetical protein